MKVVCDVAKPEFGRDAVDTLTAEAYTGGIKDTGAGGDKVNV